MPDTTLTLINKSGNRQNQGVVIFQKNMVDYPESTTVAWKVIEHLSSRDSQGSYSPRKCLLLHQIVLAIVH
jgi:hypothetical protein